VCGEWNVPTGTTLQLDKNCYSPEYNFEVTTAQRRQQDGPL